jgi:hypothetical protein
MSNESSDALKIRRAPNGKFYVWGNGEAICLPNGSLRYFGTQRDAWTFLTDFDRAEIHENWLEQHRYLNMDDLREHRNEALRQAA